METLNVQWSTTATPWSGKGKCSWVGTWRNISSSLLRFGGYTQINLTFSKFGDINCLLRCCVNNFSSGEHNAEELRNVLFIHRQHHQTTPLCVCIDRFPIISFLFLLLVYKEFNKRNDLSLSCKINIFAFCCNTILFKGWTI